MTIHSNILSRKYREYTRHAWGVHGVLKLNRDKFVCSCVHLYMNHASFTHGEEANVTAIPGIDVARSGYWTPRLRRTTYSSSYWYVFAIYGCAFVMLCRMVHAELMAWLRIPRVSTRARCINVSGERTTLTAVTVQSDLTSTSTRRPEAYRLGSHMFPVVSWLVRVHPC